MNGKAWGSTIQEVAESLLGKLKPKEGEMESTVAGLLKNSQKYQNTVAERGLRQALEANDVDVNVINDIAGKMSGKDAHSAIDSVSEQIKKATDNPTEDILKNAKEHSDSILNSEDASTVLQSASKLEKYANYPQAYFSSPDKKINHTRMAAAVGTYTAAAVGSRYLSGGNLTTDNYGQKNIVGIPFL